MNAAEYKAASSLRSCTMLIAATPAPLEKVFGQSAIEYYFLAVSSF
jgi:hypothetical protein